MNFRRIEYLLILAFLLLDIFLVYVFMGKNVPVMESSPEMNNINVSTEMKNNGITVPYEFSDDSETLPMVAGETSDVDARPERNVASVNTGENNQRIFVELMNPVSLPLQETKDSGSYVLDDESRDKINELLTNGTVLNGQDYTFLMYDEARNVIYYGCQTPSGSPVVDETAQLIFHLNDNNEIVSYEQTRVKDIIVEGDYRPLISQREAVENLYLSDAIAANSSILDATLGYQNTLTEKGTVLYRPVWLIMIRGADNSIHTETIDAINGTLSQTSQQGEGT